MSKRKPSKQQVRSSAPTIVPFMLLAGFIALAVYSLDYHHRKIDKEAWEVLSSMPEVPIRAGGRRKQAAHTLTGFKQRQAAALKDLWGIANNEIDKPVRLW